MPDRERAHAISSILDKNDGASHEIGRTLGNDSQELWSNRRRGLVTNSEYNDTRRPQRTRSQQLTKIKIDRENDAALQAGPFQDRFVGCACEPYVPRVNGVVT
jgi:hypothetical protein